MMLGSESMSVVSSVVVPQAACMLAMADGFQVSLALFELVFSAVVSVTLWRLGAWQRRYDGLESRLHETATRLIEERFRGMNHDLDSHVKALVVALDEMKQRLHYGDGEIRSLAERDQKIELALAGRIDSLKDWIREHAANKHDLEKHEAGVERKLGIVEQKLSGLTASVAVLTERVRE